MNEIERAIKTLNAIKRHMQRTANKVGAYDMSAYGMITEDIDSIELAVEALEKQLNGSWIPVSERLPQNNEHILLLLKDEKGKTAQVVGYLYHSDNENFKNLNGEFKSFDGDDLTPNFLNKEYVIAWRLLPEPY